MKRRDEEEDPFDAAALDVFQPAIRAIPGVPRSYETASPYRVTSLIRTGVPRS